MKLWHWITAALGVISVMFLASRAKAHATAEFRNDKSAEYLESNRLATKETAKLANEKRDVAMAHGVKAVELRMKGERKIAALKAQGVKDETVEKLAARFNSI
jgi:hypothetical protein